MIFYWHEIIAIFCMLNTSCVTGANIICTHGNFYRQLKDAFTLSNGDSKDFYTSLSNCDFYYDCPFHHPVLLPLRAFVSYKFFLYTVSHPRPYYLHVTFMNGITRNYVIVTQNFYTGTILDFQVQLSAAIWGAIMHQYNISNMPIYIKLQHMTEPH